MRLPIQLFVVCFACFLAGCGSSEPRLSLTKYDQVQSEIERVSKGMDEMRASKFRTAVDVLAMHALMSATSEDAQAIAPVAALNDKTPTEIIAAYEKLGPELQLKIGQQIVQARVDAPLKEANDCREKASRLADELDRLAELPAGIKRIYLLEAMNALEERYSEIRTERSYLEAARWVLSEYEKGPEYLVRAYPGLAQSIDKDCNE